MDEVTVYVVTSHRGWGEATTVEGVFGDRHLANVFVNKKRSLADSFPHLYYEMQELELNGVRGVLRYHPMEEPE